MKNPRLSIHGGTIWCHWIREDAYNRLRDDTDHNLTSPLSFAAEVSWRDGSWLVPDVPSRGCREGPAGGREPRRPTPPMTAPEPTNRPAPMTPPIAPS